MSAVSTCGPMSCSDSQSEIDKLRQSYLDKAKAADKAAGPSKIDDIVDISPRDDRRVTAAANADFGTSFDAPAPARRVDITA